MMSRREGPEALPILLPMFTAQIGELRNNKGYETSKVQQNNVKSIFELIDDNKVPKTNRNRWNARAYFLAVIAQSKELFILSALAGGNALLATFGSSGQFANILAQEALDWFRSELVPRRLTIITKFYFLERPDPEHVIFRRLFPSKNAYSLALLPLEDVAQLCTRHIQAKEIKPEYSLPDTNPLPPPGQEPYFPREGDAKGPSMTHPGIDNGENDGKEYADTHLEHTQAIVDRLFPHHDMLSLLTLPRDQLIATLIRLGHQSPRPPPPHSPLSRRPESSIIQDESGFLGSTSETEASGSTFINRACIADYHELSLPPSDAFVERSTTKDVQDRVVGNPKKRRRTLEPEIMLERPESGRWPPSSSILSRGMTTVHHSGFSGKCPGTIDSTSSGQVCQQRTALPMSSPANPSRPGAADHCNTNMTTSVQPPPTLSDRMACTVDQNAATIGTLFASPTDILPYHSSAAQRAPALTNNTADNGAIAQDLLNQDVATTNVIFESQSGIFPYNSTTAQRAPTLSNYTADDGALVYGSLDQDAATTDMIVGSQSDIFSYNGTTAQRALTLSNYTADGAMAYDDVGRYRHDWVDRMNLPY